MIEWTEVELGSVCEYRKDRIDAAFLTNSNYISTENMLSDKQGITCSNYVPTEGKSSKYSDKNILVSNIRPYFKKIWFADKDGGCSNDVIVFKADESLIFPKFLFYQLSKDEFFDFVMSGSNGTKMPRGNKSSIPSFRFLIPDILSQKRIASILSAYDDLIENNLKRIKLLEELAQRTYEEWFLKFRVNGVQLDVGENGLPERWEKKRLEECIVNFDNKRKPLAKMVREERKGNYPYYGAAGIIDYLDDFIFTGRHLLIGEDGTVITPKGNAVLQFVEGKFWVSNHAHVVIGKDYFSTEFIYCFLNKYPISQHITGAAQPKISQSNLNRIETIVANRELMILFQDKILPVINQIFNLKKQNLLLKESRDILLPRLMSGKIGVGEVLGMVAEGNNEYSSKSK